VDQHRVLKLQDVSSPAGNRLRIQMIGWLHPAATNPVRQQQWQRATLPFFTAQERFSRKEIPAGKAAEDFIAISNFSCPDPSI